MIAAPCCSSASAWAWCLELAEAALADDPDATRCLSAAIEHYLGVHHAHAS